MGGVFGDRAIELGGIVARPDSQMRGVGQLMLQAYMRSVEQNLITAHTRNPAILRMLANVCGRASVYPLNSTGFVGPDYNFVGRITNHPDSDVARSIPHTTVDGRDVAYHVNRYGDDGLYGPLSDDPADRPAHKGSPTTLKERYPGLEHKGTALVVVADYTETRAGQGGTA